MRGVVVVMRRLLLLAWSGRSEFWPWPVVGRAFGRIERGWRGYRRLRHGLCRDLLRPALPASAFDVPFRVKQALERSPLKFRAVRGLHPVIDNHLRDLRPGDLPLARGGDHVEMVADVFAGLGWFGSPAITVRMKCPELIGKAV